MNILHFAIFLCAIFISNQSSINWSFNQLETVIDEKTKSLSNVISSSLDNQEINDLIVQVLLIIRNEFLNNVRIILSSLVYMVLDPEMTTDEIKRTMENKLNEELAKLIRELQVLKDFLLEWINAPNSNFESLFDSKADELLIEVAEQIHIALTLIDIFLHERNHLLQFLIQLFNLDEIADILESLPESIKIQLVGITSLIMLATPLQMSQIQKIFDKLIIDVLADPNNADQLVLDAITLINFILLG